MQSYKVKTEDLVEQVYNSIKEMILQAKLVPGQKLVQEDMARNLGVSRTPLLAAFSKLEKEWLIESRPRRGYYIKELSKEEELNLFDIRLRVETLGALRAAEMGSLQEKKSLLQYTEKVYSKIESMDIQAFNNHDYEFHSRVMSMSRNEMLITITSSYNIVSLSNQDGIDIDFNSSIQNHLRIAKALLENDAILAENLMLEHISTGRKRILDQRS